MKQYFSLLFLFLINIYFDCTTSVDRKSASDFSMYTLDGQKRSLYSQRGKIVVLNFWATWCAPCRHEAPILSKIYQKYIDDIIVWGIALDSNRLAVELWVENLTISYPIFQITKEHQNIIEQYGANQGIPFIVLIDQKGKIYKTYKGLPKSIDIFEKDIVALMNENEE